MNPKKLLVVVFFSLLLALPIVTLAMPKQERSELENRKLQSAPELTTDNVLDKTFMNDSEKYLNDHFAFRTSWIKTNTALMLMQGKREVNGVFVDDNRLINKVQASSDTGRIAAESADAINKFAQKYQGHIDTSVMLIPNAAQLYPQDIPYFNDALNQSDYIRDFYASLKNVNCIDVASPLTTEADNYIFYRTDHHWTSYGAYVGYKTMASALGFRAATHDMFNIEHASYDFLGTNYSKVLSGEDMADMIDLYSFANGDPVVAVNRFTYAKTAADAVPSLSITSDRSIFVRDKLQEKDKYGVFLGDNGDIVQIQTNVGNGKKLLVFKDSFSHSLMQFLPIHYSEITLVDFRYLNRPLEDYVNIDNYDQAIFIYSVANFIDDSSVKKAAGL